MLSACTAAAAATIDFDAATIADLNAAFNAGTLTSEQLVQECLARVEAYDKRGPRINALIALNPAALDTARALDVERQRTGPRSVLHGVPVLLKDNFDTLDMPTTAGSILLENSVPVDDGYVVAKLRAAGAVILGKANMSEFASGPAHSSLGGQTLNPHDLTRTPSGSSGGTGAAIAAAFAPLGLGTDTGSSIRGPAAANGIVGLKPTHGLLSRDGIVPLARSFDTGGPMARSVYDVAAALGVMTGVDPADPATQRSRDHEGGDYTRFLRSDALRGARIGVARDFLGVNAEVDWVIEAALDAMRRQGATVIDVRYPQWLLRAKDDLYFSIRYPEFRAQIGDYLASLAPSQPKSIDELISRSTQVVTLRADGAGPNPARWARFEQEAAAVGLDDYRYVVVRDHALPLVRLTVADMLAADKLDAIVYPTLSMLPAPIGSVGAQGIGAILSGTNIASLTGFPDLTVPAGFSSDDLPVGISFLGAAFSEPRLLALGYSFEQATRVRRLPAHTPALPGQAVRAP